MKGKKNNILILGLGNELLTDDGIGCKLVKLLKQKYPEHFDFLCSPVGGMECIEMMCGYNEVLIIDGIISGEEPPGTVYDMKYPLHKKTLHLSNAHDISFDMSVRMAQKLNIPIPGSIRVIGIEIVEDRVFGEQLSPELQKNFKQIFCSIAESLNTETVDTE